MFPGIGQNLPIRSITNRCESTTTAGQNELCTTLKTRLLPKCDDTNYKEINLLFKHSIMTQ